MLCSDQHAEELIRVQRPAKKYVIILFYYFGVKNMDEPREDMIKIIV